jgi:hypothetical protein
MFLDELELRLETLQTALPKARMAHKAAPKHIIGFELLDVVHQEPFLRVKVAELRDSQPWAHMAEDNPLVLFCQDLQQPIIAPDTQVLCNTWKQVPTSHDLLVATVRGISNLINGNGGWKLSENFVWQLPSPLISCHAAEANTPVIHTQKLRSVGRRMSFSRNTQEDPRPMLGAMINGGLIFGRSILDKGCRAVVLDQSIASVSFLLRFPQPPETRQTLTLSVAIHCDTHYN